MCYRLLCLISIVCVSSGNGGAQVIKYENRVNNYLLKVLEVDSDLYYTVETNGKIDTFNHYRLAKYQGAEVIQMEIYNHNTIVCLFSTYLNTHYTIYKLDSQGWKARLSGILKPDSKTKEPYRVSIVNQNTFKIETSSNKTYYRLDYENKTLTKIE